MEVAEERQGWKLHAGECLDAGNGKSCVEAEFLSSVILYIPAPYLSQNSILRYVFDIPMFFQHSDQPVKALTSHTLDISSSC